MRVCLCVRVCVRPSVCLSYVNICYIAVLTNNDNKEDTDDDEDGHMFIYLPVTLLYHNIDFRYEIDVIR